MGGKRGRWRRAIERRPGRAQVLAKLELGGKLELETNAKLGMRVELSPRPRIVSDAVGQLSGRAEAERWHELRRDCVVSEIVGRCGGLPVIHIDSQRLSPERGVARGPAHRRAAVNLAAFTPRRAPSSRR